MAFRSLRATMNDDTDAGVASRSVGVIGHLRMGEMTQTGNGKKRPSVADNWIVTCKDRQIADTIADHFGVAVTRFDGNGKSMDEWEVRTGTPVLAVRMGPSTDPSRMAGHECFGGRGMIRRCSVMDDGQRQCWTPVDGIGGRTEIAGACVCEAALNSGGPAPEGGICKPALRLEVFLDVPTIPVVGTFAFKSGSEMACEEMPSVVRMLVEADIRQLMLPADLVIDRRSSRGGTQKFAVPVLRVRLPLETLVSITSGKQEQAAIDAPTVAAIEAAPAVDVPMVDAATVDSWRQTLQGLVGDERATAIALLNAIGADLKLPVPESMRDEIAQIIDYASVAEAEVVDE